MPSPHRALVLSVGLLLFGPDRPADAPAYTMTGFGPRIETIIPWAIATYAEAGLSLPEIEFVAHPTLAGCHGIRGWFTPTSSGARIDICAKDGDHFAKRLVLHELAHAWDTANLTSERRDALMASWGADQWWDDGSAEWGEYGAERAAETIAWGLIDEPIRLSRLADKQCDHLHAAYVALTGATPLHGLTDLCDR